MSDFPSLPRSQCQLHGCRWSWCRLTFDSHPELAQHVIHDHVHNAVPVRRRDIPILRRAEEGFGETLSLSGLGMSNVYDKQSQSTRGKNEGTVLEIEPTSSLPSPPVSSPTSLPTPLYDDGTDSSSDVEFPTHTLSIKPPPTTSSQVPPSMFQGRNLRESPQQPSTPTFTSLSSPHHMSFREMFVNPPTPSFDSLVEAGNKRRPSHSRNQSSQNSSSSSDSYDSVEKQLTQSMDVDNDDDSPMRPQQINGSASGIAYVGTPSNSKQAWYGTRPAHPTLTTPVSLGQTKLFTPSRTSNKGTNTHTGHKFRSGTLQITTPSSSKMFGGNERHTTSSNPRPLYDESLSQSLFQTQDYSVEYESYPPLQTQAPYQSQSLSQ